MIKKVNNNNIQGTPKEDWYHKLSIQVSLNGLSFCVLNTHEQVLEVCFSERFSKQLTPFQLQQQLKERFREKSIRKFQFSEVLTIHDNLLFSLVPQALFDSDHLANYLKYNARMLPTDHLEYDTLSGLEQLGENPEQFKLRLVGEITDQDSRFQLASAYFENTSILLPPPAPFSNSDLERSIDFTLIHTL